MEIENAKKYNYSTALHLQFSKEVKELIEKSDPRTLKIDDLYLTFSACIEKEDVCYKIVRKSNLSEIKGEVDHERGTIVIGIKHVIKAGLRHSDKKKREAAQRLKIVFDTYDKPISITKLPYDAETVAVNNLIQELNGKYVTDVQTLDMTSWVTELQDKNKEFDGLVKSYNEQQAEKPPFVMEDVRKETDSAYQDIVTFINALMIVEKTSTYDSFVTELNTLIKHYNNLYAQHIGRLQANKKRKEEEEDS
jgi:hypothetical protein